MDINLHMSRRIVFLCIFRIWLFPNHVTIASELRTSIVQSRCATIGTSPRNLFVSGGSSHTTARVNDQLTSQKSAYIYLQARTHVPFAKNNVIKRPMHLRFMEYLLLDGLLSLQTLLSLTFLLHLCLVIVGSVAADRAWHLRAALGVAIIRNFVDFLRAASISHIDLKRDGLQQTHLKIRELARNASCKFAFYSIFFLLFPPMSNAPVGTGDSWSSLEWLCLLPLTTREMVSLGWTIRDALQWMSAFEVIEEGNEVAPKDEDWIYKMFCHSVGLLVATCCGYSTSSFIAKGFEGQAELISQRLFITNFVVEFFVLWGLAARHFPSPLHRALAICVFLRILLSEFGNNPLALLNRLATHVGLVASPRKSSEVTANENSGSI